MLKKQTLEYCNWDDVEKFLCEKLGIANEHFRDYHFATIYKGMSKDEYWSSDREYRDFWHVWLEAIYNDVSNDSIKCVWFDMITNNLQSEEFRKRHKYGEWIIDLIEPIKALEKEIGSDHMYIYYSW